MTAGIRFVLLAIILAFLTSFSVAADMGGQHSSCTPSFPFKNGWLGADVASSVPLPDGRVFWIFGDTLYGDKRVVVGNDPVMTRNSIGVSTCKEGKWNIDYTIRRDKSGKESDYFVARKPNTWYWALNGAYNNDELWVTLLCVRAVPNDPDFALGFTGCGADLARITGLKATDPQKWKIQYQELVPDGVNSYPTADAVFLNNYLHIFSINDFGDRSQVVTRIPVKGLKDVKKNLEYLASDGTWKPGFDAKAAKAVMGKGASELTIRYHPELKKWLAVMFEPQWMSDKIILRTADDLTGPWTEGEVIHQVPEMKKENSGYDPDTFCYAAKEHREFEKPGELVFTYVCNSMKPPKVADLLNIYFPQVVRTELPKQK